jgi:hypothetical protein
MLTNKDLIKAYEIGYIGGYKDKVKDDFVEISGLKDKMEKDDFKVGMIPKEKWIRLDLWEILLKGECYD